MPRASCKECDWPVLWCYFEDRKGTPDGSLLHLGPYHRRYPFSLSGCVLYPPLLSWCRPIPGRWIGSFIGVLINPTFCLGRLDISPGSQDIANPIFCTYRILPSTDCHQLCEIAITSRMFGTSGRDTSPSHHISASFLDDRYCTRL